MKKAVNYVRGSVCAEITCPYPERFVNVCAQNGIEFWRLRRVSGTVVTVYIHIGGYRRLRSLADAAGFSVKPVKKNGAPFFLWRIRKRYMLLIGMLLCLLVVRVLSLFVWEIEVLGNENIPAGLILDTLDDLGVGIGSFGPGIVSESVANDVILQIPELSWIAINVSGSRAAVLVRERIPKPVIVDEHRPTMIVAEKSGIIAKMSVMEGLRTFTVGDTVEEGDILVTGILDSISSGRRTVHALAEVYARTWYDLSAEMPLDTIIKEHTGESRKKMALVIAGKKINLFLNGGNNWPYYDKITDKHTLRLSRGITLPLSIITEEYFEYSPLASALSVSDIERILQARLSGELYAEVGDGEIIESRFETAISGGVVTVTLHAECLEEISAERDFTDAEIAEGAITPPQERGT